MKRGVQDSNGQFQRVFPGQKPGLCWAEWFLWVDRQKAVEAVRPVTQRGTVSGPQASCECGSGGPTVYWEM